MIEGKGTRGGRIESLIQYVTSCLLGTEVELLVPPVGR